MNELNLSNLPEEPTVDVLDPDGNIIWTGNNTLHFDEIRAQIKEKQLAGYRVRTKSGGVYEINTYGRVGELDAHPVEGELPGDIWMSVVERLL